MDTTTQVSTNRELWEYSIVLWAYAVLLLWNHLVVLWSAIVALQSVFERNLNSEHRRSVRAQGLFFFFLTHFPPPSLPAYPLIPTLLPAQTTYSSKKNLLCACVHWGVLFCYIGFSFDLFLFLEVRTARIVLAIWRFEWPGICFGGKIHLTNELKYKFFFNLTNKTAERSKVYLIFVVLKKNWILNSWGPKPGPWGAPWILIMNPAVEFFSRLLSAMILQAKGI